MPISQVLLGSDYPFGTSADGISGLEECGLNSGDLEAIYSGNAERLLPLRTVAATVLSAIVFLPGCRMVLASYQLRGGISPNSHLLWGPTLGGRKKQERLQSAQSCRGPCQDNRMAREGGASRLTG